MSESQELYNDISGILAGIDLMLVDLGVSRHGKSVHVRVVAYRAGGIGIDECARAHRAVQPLLASRYGEDGYDLEVSSPGIDREIRHAREYAMFAGRGVRLTLADGTERAGRILSSDGALVTLSQGDAAPAAVPITDIRKSKLDSSQEGR